mgnify:CR=1 FL=1
MEKVTVLYPGGFKPPHGGHIDLIRKYAELPEVKEIWVLVGPGVRDGIVQDQAVQMLEKLTEDIIDFFNDSQKAAEILDKQLEIHQNLPKNVAGLHALCRPELDNYVDPEGKFIWSNGEIVCNFGRNFGWTLKQLASQTPDYLQWMLSSDFSPDVKKLVYNALQGKFPKPKVK